MVLRVFLLLLIVNAVQGQDGTPAPGRRIGIVLANSTYSQLPSLPHAIAEGTLIAESLKKAGFSVEIRNNNDRAGIQQLDADLDSLVKKGDAVFLYFSGYALQGEDDNYLLPVDFDPQAAGDLEARAYHLTRLAQRLQRIGANLKIIAIEGCRPIEGVIPGVPGPGLTEPSLESLQETLYAFAASNGQTSVGGTGKSALFTDALAKKIAAPGSRLKNVFDDAKTEVYKASNGAQTPQTRDNVVLNDQFYFIAALKIAPEIRTERVIVTEKAKFVPAQNPKDREEYVLLPGGEFMMGCVPGDNLCDKDENPQHKVKITKPFWMGRNEVQVISYQRYVDSDKKALKMPSAALWNPKWKITNTPITMVTVEEARGYCAWAGGRLPTEAEWEYAARAGKTEVYPLSFADSREKANFEGKQGNDRFDYAAPVRSFDPSVWNLFDMAGNVWEMANDLYSQGYYAESADTDPKGPADGKQTVKRGGSFDSDAKKHLRISIRKPFVKSDNATGFRCVLDDTPETHQLLRLP